MASSANTVKWEYLEEDCGGHTGAVEAPYSSDLLLEPIQRVDNDYFSYSQIRLCMPIETFDDTRCFHHLFVTLKEIQKTKGERAYPDERDVLFALDQLRVKILAALEDDARRAEGCL